MEQDRIYGILGFIDINIGVLRISYKSSLQKAFENVCKIVVEKGDLSCMFYFNFTIYKM